MESTSSTVPVLLWSTRQVSLPEAPLVLDEKFFQITELHKYQEIVNHYTSLLHKEEVMDTIILNKYIHRRCTCCTRYTCSACLTIIFYHKDDFLLPYCDRCECFLQIKLE